MQICQIPYDRDPAAGNMAIDATLLAFGHATEQAVWRIYGWTESALTFGYSQSYEWVCSAMPDFKGARIRRMTGGGIVDHRNDITYAITIPPGHPAYRCPATELYRQLHARIANVLMESGIPADLAPCAEECGGPDSLAPAGLCFEAPEPFDVIHPVTGAKIAGAAMKRHRDGILIQGSLNRSMIAGLSVKSLEKEFSQFLSIWLDLQPVIFTGTLPVQILTRELDQYTSREWNEKR